MIELLIVHCTNMSILRRKTGGLILKINAMKNNSKLRTKKIVICLLLSLLLIPITGCSPNILIKSDEQIAANFIRLLGYTIVSYDGESPKYTLDRELLKNLGEFKLWGVQKTKPEQYIGKEIHTFKFTVTNHPLQKIFSHDLYDILVTVMIVDHNVIGGTSLPNYTVVKTVMAGGVFSIQGKDTDKIKGMSYDEWLDYWKENFGFKD